MSILVSTGIIETFQSYSSALFDVLFQGFTIIFSPTMLIVFCVLLFWLGHKSTWAHALTFMIFVGFSVVLFKTLFSMPRPPESLHRIKAESYGFPSGHSTAITGGTGWLIYVRRSWKVILMGIFITLMVSLSRVYLGVHYIRDIFGGILLGTMLVCTGILVKRKLKLRLSKMSRTSHIITVLIISLLMLIYSSTGRHHGIDGVKLSGLFLGFWWGRMAFIKRYGGSNFEVPLKRSDIKTGAVRILVGIPAVIVPLLLCEIVIMQKYVAYITNSILFFILTGIGILISYVLPVLFNRIETPNRKPQPE